MSRVYEIEGVEYPSVTTVLDTLSKGDALMRWASEKCAEYFLENLLGGMTLEEIISNAKVNYSFLKDDAAEIGSKVHHLIELHLKGYHIVLGNERKEVQNGFMAFMKWKRKVKPVFLKSEMTVVSKKYGYAGTLDGLALINGEIVLIDFKNCNNFYDSMPMQLSGYREGVREMQLGIKIQKNMILRLDKFTGEFEEKFYPHEKHLNAFLKLLDFYYAQKSRRLKNNPRAKNRDIEFAHELEMSLPGKAA